jgi:PAS domain S-box-containing protein
MPIQSVRVLLVEASPWNARLLQEQLSAISLEPLDITPASNFDEARTRLRNEAFDIALLDLSIPGGIGMDGVRCLRCMAPLIPIIGLTRPGDDALGNETKRDNDLQEFIAVKRNDPQAIAQAIHYAIQQKRAKNGLRESEERFRLACEASRAMVYDIDARTGNAILVRGLPLLLGYDPEDALRNKEWWFAQIHQDDISAVLSKLQEFRSRGNDYSLQYRVRHIKGTYLWVEDTGRNILDEAGRAVRTIGSVVDITQRKQAEDALRQSEQRYHELAEELEQMVMQRTEDLEQRSQQLRTLAAELAHAEERERKRLAQAIHDDLQQLLVGAKLCAESLAGGVKEDLHKTVLRMNQFLSEAIESARSLTFELSPPILHNAGLARSLHYLARQMEAKHGLKVHVEADEQAEPETEDLKILLFQATRELLFNVIKHAHVRTAEVEMRRFEENMVQISVSDSGAGFDSEKCNEEETQRGFGLFSIRGRLDLIGGWMEVRSAPGSGSRCAIMAPIRKSLPAERVTWWTAPVQQARPRGGMMRAGRKIRVLVAHDHAIVRQGLMRLLQGHKDIAVVGEATDGHETLQQAKRLNPDVIIMEVNMPRLDGIETTARLQKEVPQIKVIGLSAGEELEQGAAMCKAGAVAFLNKTNRLEALVAAIRSSIAGAA